jgi:hypothetical protein
MFFSTGVTTLLTWKDEQVWIKGPLQTDFFKINVRLKDHSRKIFQSFQSPILHLIFVVDDQH